jgi:N-acetylmuramoyl-L-alanine amidase
MRKTVPALFVVALVPALIVLPVVTPPRAAPHPVAPHIVAEPLAGVDAAAWQALRTTPAAGSGLSAATVTAKPAVLTPALATAPYQLVGITWNANAKDAGFAASVRIRPTGGAWGPWEPLSIGDAGPDLGSVDAKQGRTGTEPLVAGPSDGVQVRVDTASGLAPAGLRLELIDPGTSAADASIGAAPPGSSAAAAMAQPAIISRAQWGADESLRNGFAGYSDTIKVGFVHHTVSSNAYTSAAGAAAQIRAIYAYDTKGLGWSDIAYNFLVDKFGDVFEGRAGGVSLAVIGSHTAGFNYESFAVAALGCFDTTCSGGGLRPPAAMVTSIARVMAWKLGLFYRDPTGTGTLTSSGIGGTNLHHPIGQLVTTPTISGHRDVDATACPGNLLYPYLPSIRAQAAAFLPAGLVAPHLSTNVGSYSSAGPVIASAVLGTQTYGGSVADICRGGTVASLPTGSASRSVPINTSWNGKTSTNAWPRPGPYRITLTSAGAKGTAVPWSTTYTVNAPTPANPTAGSAVTGDGGFVPVTQFRLLDTRTGVYPTGPHGRVDLQVLGRGGVPTHGVTSVFMTLTVTCASAGSFLTLYPGGTTLPITSNENFLAGQTRSVLVALPVGSDGTVSIYNSAGTTQIIADVLGYGAANGGAELTPVPLTRVFGTAGTAAGKLGTGEARAITLPTLGGVPGTSLTAVMVNLVAAAPAAANYLSAYPAGSPWPGTSNLSYPAGVTTDTTEVVPVSHGQFMVRNNGLPVDAAVDVIGVFAPHSVQAGGRLTAISGERAVDTRLVGGPIGSGASRVVTVAGGTTGVPAGATAVLVSLTGVAPTAATNLMAWATPASPVGATVPPGAMLRLNAGDVRANLVLVPVGSNGQITVRNAAGSTNVIVDVMGYYQ